MCFPRVLCGVGSPVTVLVGVGRVRTTRLRNHGQGRNCENNKKMLEGAKLIGAGAATKRHEDAAPESA